MRSSLPALSCCALLAAGQLLGSADAAPPGGVRAAAQEFLATLGPAERARAVFERGDAELERWHFVPRQRAGLSLRAMGPAQRRAAHALLQTALTSAGYHKLLGVLSLEDELQREALARGQDGSGRDPLLYWVQLYGEPGEDAWGWRFEGHHLSITWSLEGDELQSVTPTFFGASPHTVRQGERAGWRVLGAEEELARSFLAALDEGQLSAARVAQEAPRDVLLGPGAEVDLETPWGLECSSLDAQQRELLMDMVREYTGVHRPSSSRPQRLWEQLRAGGAGVHFAWAGGIERGQAHYYRLANDTLVIEYANTQDGANHSHVLLRDAEHDLGGTALRGQER